MFAAPSLGCPVRKRVWHIAAVLLLTLTGYSHASAAEAGETSAATELSHPGFFFDVMYLNTYFSNARASGTIYNAPPCFLGFCNTVTAEHDVQFGRESGIGLRGSWYANEESVFGFAVEMDSAVGPSAGGVSISYLPLSFMPMARLPISLDKQQRIDLYAGAVFTIALGATVSVSFPELPAQVSGSAGGGGVGPLFGIAWRFSPTQAIFSEVRATRMNLQFPYGNATSDQAADANFITRQMILGVSFRF